MDWMNSKQVSVLSNDFQKWLNRNTFILHRDCYDQDEQQGRAYLHNDDRCEFIGAYLGILDREEYWN